MEKLHGTESQMISKGAHRTLKSLLAPLEGTQLDAYLAVGPPASTTCEKINSVIS